MNIFKAFWSVYFTYFKALILSFGNVKKASPFYSATQNLFGKTFRIPESEKTSSKLFLSIALNTLKKHPERKACRLENNQSGIFIYDGGLSSYDQRKEYCEHFLPEKINGGFFLEGLCFLDGVWEYVNYCIGLLFIFPLILVRSLRLNDKGPLALIPKEIVETYQLLRLCKNFNVKELYHFNIYEKNSNILTLILQQNNLKVCKIPSEVPLAIWNSIIIADKLCICNAYQYEELNYFKSGMYINETEYWGPEMMMKVFKQYDQPIDLKASKNKIGFYSTAAWVRKRSNHVDQGFNMVENEFFLSKLLYEYCRINPDKELLVFLHPKEKNFNSQEVSAYYESIYHGINYRIINENKSTAELFDKCDIAVAFNSTIIYERLYFGFKSLLMPLSFRNFPIKNSSIENICVFTREALFTKLDHSFLLSPEEFFKESSITNYSQYKRTLQ